jgi:hypothetical protein
LDPACRKQHKNVYVHIKINNTPTQTELSTPTTELQLHAGGGQYYLLKDRHACFTTLEESEENNKQLRFLCFTNRALWNEIDRGKSFLRSRKKLWSTKCQPRYTIYVDGINTQVTIWLSSTLHTHQNHDNVAERRIIDINLKRLCESTKKHGMKHFSQRKVKLSLFLIN